MRPIVIAAGVAGLTSPLARDYVTAFDGLAGGGDDEARNDVGVFAGIGMRF